MCEEKEIKCKYIDYMGNCDNRNVFYSTNECLLLGDCNCHCYEEDFTQKVKELEQQLQTAKEEKERLINQNKLFKGTIKKFNLDWYEERLIFLTQQNKQMREALEKIADYYSPSCDCGLSSISCPDLGVCRLANIAQQALKGGE